MIIADLENETASNKADEIITAIQRGEETEDVRELIEIADKFLLGDTKEIPDFLTPFLERTSNDLKSTINNCVKTRNNPEKKDDLKKYKEGYFNEIIQNANDIVNLTGINNPSVDVTVSKEAVTGGEKYSVVCRYPDKGFSLKNIYGFCTKGNSDKNASQEGMYGVGIKSLFCFVDEFSIESNIRLSVSSAKSILDTVELSYIESANKSMTTTLSFSFTWLDDEKQNKHAGFNTKKLKAFIDDVYDKKENYNRYFFSGNDNELIFDARSLFFTDLRGERDYNNSIKEIVVKQDENTILTIKSEETVLLNENALVKKAVVSDEDKYIVIHFPKDEISLAFKCNQGDTIGSDRLYSTYFIGSTDKGYLGIPTGCLVNTKAINSSRSGLERENEKDPVILGEIMKKGREAIGLLCGLAGNNADVLDVLCQLLSLYSGQAVSDDDVLSPIYIFEKSFDILSKSIANWKFGEKKYILLKEDGVDNEKQIITQNVPENDDKDNLGKLYTFYKEHFFLNDTIVYGDDDYQKLSCGVNNLYKAFFSDTNKYFWISCLPLPFMREIQDLITKRIGGSSFSTILKYLNDEQFDEKNRLLAKQLIARYKVNNKYFDFMGNFSRDTIGEWLFMNTDGAKNEVALQEQYAEYEREYSHTRDLIRDKICNTNYYISGSNSGYGIDRWWYDFVDGHYLFKSFEKNTDICDDDVLLLLKLIHDKILYVGLEFDGDTYSGYSFYRKKRFINSKDSSIILHNRNNKNPTSWDGSFKCINVNILDYAMKSFDNFVAARKLIDEYDKWVSEKYTLQEYITKCVISEIALEEISLIFKWLATYDLDRVNQGILGTKYYDAFTIRNITFNPEQESESDLIRFVKKFVDNTFIRVETISTDSRNHFIGYVTNINNHNGIFIKQKASDSFVKVGNVGNISKKFLLIYSNFSDEQKVLSEVVSNLNLKCGCDDEVCSYVNNFINTDNVRNVSSELYERFLQKKKLEHIYPFEIDDLIEGDMTNVRTMEDIYAVLSDESSYDNHCPICNQIPTLNIKGNDDSISNLEKRNSLIAMLVAKYRGNPVYVKILCCKSCFEEYKHSLTEATIRDCDGYPYKKLILKNRISTDDRNHDIINEVPISPDNWNLICTENKIE